MNAFSSALPPDPSQRLDLDSTIFPIKDANGRVTHADACPLDLTDRKAADARLLYHLELEQAMAEFSALMIKPGCDDLDDRINWALERIGRLTRADRSSLFIVMPDGQRASNVYEWCAPGIDPQIQVLQTLPVADYEPFRNLLQSSEVVELQTDQLPDETVFKPLLRAGQTRSLICVPIRWNEQLRGLISFDAVTVARTWPAEEARFLRMVAEIIAHTWQRLEADRALRDNARFLEHLDTISHILTRREKDADLLANLAAALLEMFQADRAFFIHPCDPDAACFRVTMAATRPQYPGAFASGDAVTLDDCFRDLFRQALRREEPVLAELAATPSDIARRYGIQSQMVIALYPQADQPWLLGLHQCAHARRWTDAEQRLFQAIAERVSDALSGYLLLRQLQDSEERFAKAFHASPALMCITDIATGCFLDANALLLNKLEYTREQLIGYTSVELGFYPDPGTREQMIAQLHQNGLVRELPIRFQTRTGNITETLYSAEILHLGERNVLLSLVYDITDRKRAEAELQQHRNHLEELVAERTAELRQAMAQLVQAEKLAALGNLVAGVAHELSTPLGNTRVVASSLGDDLRAFVAAVESGSLRRSQVDAFLNRSQEAVSLLERNTARAADLINQFKQVAMDQTSARRRRFNLRQTLEEMLATLRPLFKHTTHRLKLDIPPDLELDSYPGPLEQVIVNLINNSLIHGFVEREAGLIRLHVEAFDADRVQLRYADDGVGISEKIQNRIFDPFFTTQLGSGGSGLGLYIVYNIVTVILGGTIQVQGSPGAGTTFTLILPRIAPNRPALAPAA